MFGPAPQPIDPMPDVVCAILAAGRATRMGVSKSALKIDEIAFVERALTAAAPYPTAIVCSPRDDLVARVAARFGARVVENGAPERGMTHSLRLANETLGAPAAALAVLLIDTPFVDGDVVARVISAAVYTDIAYPVSAGGEPGHPVVFGPRARRAIGELDDGDTLRRLRDDVRFSHTRVAFADRRPFTDVDTPADLERVVRFRT